MATLPFDEKRPFAEEVLPEAVPARRRTRCAHVAVLAVFGIILLGYLRAGIILSVWGIPGPAPQVIEVAELAEAPHAYDTQHAFSQRVPLEAHIMSKCPDALDCLRKLVLPTMQVVYDKVNFTLSYIGTPTADGGIACKHGPGECLGNILELCAASLYPDPKTYLGFTMCLTRDYPSIPARSLVEDCALEHAVDFEALNECATRDDGAYGLDLLRKSVAHSTTVGVTKSCTVRLDEEVYCIRDDGEWKDCPHGAGVNDLILAVEKLYRE